MSSNDLAMGPIAQKRRQNGAQEGPQDRRQTAGDVVLLSPCHIERYAIAKAIVDCGEGLPGAGVYVDDGNSTGSTIAGAEPDMPQRG